MRIFRAAMHICVVCVAGAAPVNRTAVQKVDRHVVIVVWDGMRPDFVNAQNTPALWKLAQSGVIFRNHHSVYPSATIVNGTAINTGVYPDRSGIIANYDYLEQIDSRKSLNVESARVVRKGDELSHGHYVSAPTLAELIQKSGGRTVVAAAKTVGLLFDREKTSPGSYDLFAGESTAPDWLAPITKYIGTFPAPSHAAARDSWTTRVLTEFLWHDAIPTFSLLWLSEPDDTEHKTAPGSPQALAAIKSSDDNLGRVLTALEKQNATSTTDVFVVSDHGFSTISRSIDVPKILRDAGFDAVTQFAGEPKPGQVMVVGNGGTVLFYVIGHDETVTRRLVEFLQRSDFAGVIFTRAAMDGTFTFEQAKIDSPLQNYGATHNEQGPDVEMAFRWSKDKNRFGIAGMIDADWQRAAGEGTHATLSRYDMHNTLIAAGPDFRRGETDDLPSGNVDLAPTICSILQIEPTAMDGRILSEALSAGQSPTSETHKIEAGKNFSNGRWQQELKISRIGETIYLDEGNGFFEHQQ